MDPFVEELLKADASIWDSVEAGDYGFPFILQGIMLLRQGALVAGGAAWANAQKTKPSHLALIRTLVPPDRLLNAAAEMSHAFEGEREDHRRVLLLLGGLLGDQVADLDGFYEDAPSFLTRVVGLRHEGRADRLERLDPGGALILERQPDNPYDPHAVLVREEDLGVLGYLRRPLAKVLSRQMERGILFQAFVQCVLEEPFP
ncbi:MAG: HIRAN domain-containing protein, partial [Firmicutes bacterium]|nr:HIRAN domain-containing protein [Bacillota bacterium]